MSSDCSRTLDRAWPSLAVRAHGRVRLPISGSIVLPLVVVAIALAFIAGARVLPALRGTASTCSRSPASRGRSGRSPSSRCRSSRTRRSTPIVRLTGALVILSAALVTAAARRGLAGNGRASPGGGLTVAHARSLGDRGSRCRGVPARRCSLSRARPDFPSRTDCTLPPTGEGELQVVFGYRDSEIEALELRDRVLAVGFLGTEIARDGCGRVRVAVDDVPSLEVGEEVIRRGATVGLEPTLEQEPQ